MLSQKLVEELNVQITFEYYSHHFYLDMASYCYGLDLDGVANFFLVQAEEERFHAMRFYKFINDMDGVIKMTGIEDPCHTYEGVLDAFEKALSHEKEVTARIYHLMDVATEEREHATMSFLKWFIDEQVEEEATFKSIVQKLKRAGNDQAMLYAIDTELGQRIFTPPTIA